MLMEKCWLDVKMSGGEVVSWGVILRRITSGVVRKAAGPPAIVSPGWYAIFKSQYP